MRPDLDAAPWLSSAVNSRNRAIYDVILEERPTVDVNYRPTKDGAPMGKTVLMEACSVANADDTLISDLLGRGYGGAQGPTPHVA